MFIKTTAVALVVSGIAIGSTAAQSSLTPQQSTSSAATDQTPIFRVTVVARYDTGDQLPAARRPDADRLRRHAVDANARRAAPPSRASKGYIEDGTATFDELGAPSGSGPST